MTDECIAGEGGRVLVYVKGEICESGSLCVPESGE